MPSASRVLAPTSHSTLCPSLFQMQQVMVYFMILYCCTHHILSHQARNWLNGQNMSKLRYPNSYNSKQNGPSAGHWVPSFQSTECCLVPSFQQPNQPRRLEAGPSHHRWLLSGISGLSEVLAELMAMKEVMTNTWEVITFPNCCFG